MSTLYRQFSTQEEIDAEYDLESVLDMQPYIEWFINGSAQARADLQGHFDVRFGPTLDETLDIFPASTPNAPVLIFIHGGWWRSLSSKEFSLVARGPVAHGVTVVVTNYSLCPKVSLSEITRQSRAAVSWVYQHIADYGGNSQEIFVSGHSAGGHQVGMLSLTDWVGEYDLPDDVIKGGIPISGLFDLRPFRYSWLQPKLLLSHEDIERQSPLFHIAANAPDIPLLVTLGDAESAEFHRQSETFVDAWRSAGARADTFEQPEKDHITAIAGLEDPESALCTAIIDFMATVRTG